MCIQLSLQIHSLLMLYFIIDGNNIHKCEWEQCIQLCHNRITCDAIESNTVIYKTFNTRMENEAQGILKFSLS